MANYIVRRLFYGVLVLVGVNLLTFVLFFAVNTPDDMARMNIGGKRVSADAIQKWKAERGYDKPLLWNEKAQGSEKLTQTLFFQRSLPLFVLDFGATDTGRDIAYELSQRAGPSLAVAAPTFLLGVFAVVVFSLVLVFFRATYLEFWGVAFCVFFAFHFRAVLHHCRAVFVLQNAQSGTYFRLFERAGRGGVFDFAGADRNRLPFGR